VSTVPSDEIHEKYLQKAISEINELGDEIVRAAGGAAVPVLGSGHPLADVFLLKHRPQSSEAQEGVAFYGRAGQAVLKSLQRLRVDPMAVYGTNCVKFAAGAADDEARGWLTRELHIVQPKLLVVMARTRSRSSTISTSRSPNRSSPSSASSSASPDGRGARRPGHRHVAGRAAGEDRVLERLQGGRLLVGRAASVLRRPRGAAGARVVRAGHRRLRRRCFQPRPAAFRRARGGPDRLLLRGRLDPAISIWWEVAVLAFGLMPAVFLFDWLVLPLARARGSYRSPSRSACSQCSRSSGISTSRELREDGRYSFVLTSSRELVLDRCVPVVRGRPSRPSRRTIAANIVQHQHSELDQTRT